MKTITNIIGMACLATCFCCTSTAKTIIPSKKYVTEKHNISSIETISTSSSIDIVYHQTNGKPYAEIYASDNLMPYIALEVSNGQLTAFFKEYLDIRGQAQCRIDVYAPSVTNFATNASGDISIPKGLKSGKYIRLRTNASGDITCPSIICESLNAQINASGDIEINKATCQNASLQINASGDLSIAQIECEENCNAEINGSGDISVSGNSPKAIYANKASGDLEAYGLKADEVNAKVYGSGDISCHASKAITAQSYGSGKLEYHGNPSQINTDGKNIRKK